MINKTIFDKMDKIYAEIFSEIIAKFPEDKRNQIKENDKK